MSNDAKQLYILTFLKQNTTNPDKDFDDMYHRRYGRYRLIVPTMLLIVVILPLSSLVVETALTRLIIAHTGDAHPALTGFDRSCGVVLPGRAIAAIVGAYIWIAYSLIIGASNYDMPPSLLLSSTMRMITAAPLGYAVSALANPGLGTFLAFAIGVFPLQSIQILLQRFANKQLNLDSGASERPDQVRNLDGVDPPTADRLQDAGITTVAQLAYCDPVQLSLRTNIRFDAIIDLTSQSLARIYLGNKLDALMAYGLRGASEMRNLMDDLNSRNAATKTDANLVLEAAAEAVKMPPIGLRHTFYEIGHDPYAEFLQRVWSDK